MEQAQALQSAVEREWQQREQQLLEQFVASEHTAHEAVELADSLAAELHELKEHGSALGTPATPDNFGLAGSSAGSEFKRATSSRERERERAWQAERKALTAKVDELEGQLLDLMDEIERAHKVRRFSSFLVQFDRMFLAELHSVGPL